MAWVVKNVSFRSLALPLNRLSLHDSDRDAGASSRSVSTTFDQTQNLRRSLADGLHISDRRAGDAAHV